MKRTFTQSFFYTHRYRIAVGLLFLFHVFFSFYQLEYRAIFGWDQVNNAWTSLRILTEGKYPLLGMVAKGNSGMYIGPLYYYLTALFYFFTHLDPIASPILAGVTSVFSFFVLYVCTKKIFNRSVAITALSIFTFSSFIIQADRVQWPVNFIAPVSLIILCLLYRVFEGKWNYLPFLSLVLGLSFHIHFTSIYYLIIIACTLPFLPYDKKIIKYIPLSIGIFLLCFTPQFLFYVQTRNSGASSKYAQYFQTYFHGFHLRRLLQIAHDGFIQFEFILLPFRFLRNTVFFYLPIFLFLYAKKYTIKHSWKLLYLCTLWVLVPWIVLSTYRGELSDYYFFVNQYVAIMILSYITVWIINQKKLLLTIAIGTFWLWYMFLNVQKFFQPKEGDLLKTKRKVIEDMKEGKIFHFTEGVSEYYFYYIYSR